MEQFNQYDSNDQSNYDSSNQNQPIPNSYTVNSNPTTLYIVIRKICQKCRVIYKREMT